MAIGQRAAPGIPLVIRGEPGVGKDTLARLIHAASTRQSYPFIKANCAIRPVDRCDADLFGYEQGGSPLGTRRRLGGLEFANRGTIYLDEIAALPRALVPKLVHLLRTGEVARTGGCEIIRVDVRVIGSTVPRTESGGDGDLGQELCRLDMVEICLPPLRQRTEEIPIFISFFLERLNRRYRRDVQLCPDVIAEFQASAWPGNLRELEEAVHRLVVGGTRTPVH